jgi:hypothetical protein
MTMIVDPISFLAGGAMVVVGRFAMGKLRDLSNAETTAPPPLPPPLPPPSQRSKIRLFVRDMPMVLKNSMDTVYVQNSDNNGRNDVESEICTHVGAIPQVSVTVDDLMRIKLRTVISRAKVVPAVNDASLCNDCLTQKSRLKHVKV